MNDEFLDTNSAWLRAFDARPANDDGDGDDGEYADALGAFRGLLAAIAITAVFWIAVICAAAPFWS